MRIPHRLRRGFGADIEALATTYLSNRGLQPIARNYYCRGGEIDLIARDGESIVFVEVRMRRSDSHGTAEETVTRAKQQKIIRCARYFLLNNPHLARHPCRFDIIGISGGRSRQHYEIHWLKNAFQDSW